MQKLIKFLERQNPPLSESENKALHRAKVELIFGGLVTLSRIIETFKPENRDNGLLSVVTQFEGKTGNFEGKSKTITREVFSDLKNDEPWILEAYKRFLSQNYEAPKEPDELFRHLHALFIAWGFLFFRMDGIPFRVLVHFDHALSLILGQVGLTHAVSLQVARILDGSKNGARGNTEKVKYQRERVEALLKEMKIDLKNTPKKDTPIAREVISRWREKYNQPPPSEKTLLRRIKEIRTDL